VYPLQLSTLKKGLTLYVPDPSLVKLTYQRLVAENTETIFPYWAKIWASSDAMIQFFQDEPTWIQNKIVLEIGAGIGVPSFSIAELVQKIIISDYAADAVTLLQKNIEHLKLTNAMSLCIDWNSVSDDIIADTILFSDTIYNPAEHNNLVLLIEKFLKKGSNIVIATPARLASNHFLQNISKYIFYSKIYSVIENGNGIEINVLVLKK
jgi:predicted nicotinamide N-methyase